MRSIWRCSTHIFWPCRLQVQIRCKEPGAPAEEVFGSDSAKFAKAPWDVMLSYHFRASRAVMSVPEASRLALLEQRDIAERAAWVSQFREGDDSLGQVVQSVIEKRGAHWDSPMQIALHAYTVESPNPSIQQQQSGGQQQSKKQKGQHTGQSTQSPQNPPRTDRETSRSRSSSPMKMAPGSVTSTLRDGTVLCSDFNKGECLGMQHMYACSNGAHRCGKVVRKGRPCAGTSHGAHNCRSP